MNLDGIREKEGRIGIGLMSGTSCDGIDAALVRCVGSGMTMRVKPLEFTTFAYPEGIRSHLLRGVTHVEDLCTLNFDLGGLLADAAEEMLARARELDLEVDFVASHGHTITHLPPRPESKHAGTLQIGEPAVIAERVNLPVVSDFRTRDMAAGGQGAPLVAYADWVLFHRHERTVACLNVGGICNVTVVPPKLGNVIAFDTGPGNMALDGAIRLLTKGAQDMDEDGALAARGEIIGEFYDYLLSHPFFKRMPPKSTGREDFDAQVYLRDAIAARRAHYPIEDLMATVTASVAGHVTQALERFVSPNHDLSRLIVSGGGAHNKTLLKLLNERLPEQTVLRTTDAYGLSADAKEAIAFALLGNETLCGAPSNVPGATGATKRVVLGKITPP